MAMPGFTPNASNSPRPTRRISLGLGFGLLTMWLGGGGVDAQSPPSSSPATRTLFFLHEVGYDIRLNGFSGTNPNFHRRHHFTADVAMMTDWSPGLAVGLSGLFATDQGFGSRFGLQARTRTRLAGERTLDLFGGPLLWDSRRSGHGPGITGGASFAWTRSTALSVRAESVPGIDPTPDEVALYAGVRMSGKHARLVQLGGAAVGAVWAIVVLVGCSSRPC